MVVVQCKKNLIRLISKWGEPTVAYNQPVEIEK